MIFALEIDNGVLSYDIATPPIFVYGNTGRSITLNVNRKGNPLILSSPSILFTLRDPSDFTGPALAETATFSLMSPTGPYTASLNLFTVEMESFIGTETSRDALLQVTIIQGGDSQSSAAIPCIIQNYTANPNSGSPTPLPDPALVWLAEHAVMYSQVQSLTQEEQIRALLNIGIDTNEADGYISIMTNDGVRYIAVTS